ncbi:bridge-like lipid transfer protein family member 1 isoform X6 [Babylonia areolata]|uniref:bridge-like lipid transfer protein family member 1 isoform X6 n=1 Tax=Babylonia areolata TaxID=304850 RepID=UPI003FD2DBFC
MKDYNQSVLERWSDELPQSTVYWMLIAIVCAQAWTIYLTYYNSRVIGLILTAILNRFIKDGHIRLGSFSFSVLSGKLMFRDVHLITEDFSVRIQIGWIIFRWWRPYVYKHLTEDMSHSETRLSVFVDGFEFHVYNRSQTYANLEKLFGLDPGIISETPDPDPKAPARIKVPESSNIHWRDLIPMIKMDINSGRVVFGNYLVPHSLLIKFEKADVMYTTKPASTLSDVFMHVVKCEAENLRVMFVPSPKYNGPLDEPPRTMGEGFVVLQSNSVDIYFYMDEPGLVPHEPELLQMADGEVLVRRTYPCSGVDIKCGKNTDLSYGPWADRQREHLWKMFYPADYQPMVPTPEAQPGEKRVHKTLELKLTINANSTIDILFTKNLVTQAIHMNAGKGSYVEAVIPWTVEDTGYVTKVKGQLMLVDATTSMTYRSLFECETFEFEITANYPLIWNEHQDWRVDFTACKAVVYIIFAHKDFFRDLADDWSSKAVPDLYSFVPYTWTINLIVKQFELITLANEHNWMDTSSHNQENTQIAFCGELFDLCVTLPYTDFLPPTFPIQIVIKGETVDCRLYLPENNTLRHVIVAISNNMKIVDRDGNEMDKPFGYNNDKQWRNLTQRSAGWVDCWHTSYVSLTVTYIYHPMPLLQSLHDHHLMLDGVTTPELEESILSPLRPDVPGTSKAEVTAENFDPNAWESDRISVELEVAPSVLALYGSLLRNLIHVKEDYFGEDQRVSDIADNVTSLEDMEGFVHINSPGETTECDLFDPRLYRPFAVTVSVTLHDIQAHLVKNCNKDDPPCPCVHVERLCFEMDKKYTNTKLQLLLSPCVLIARDLLQREGDQEHLRDGHLALSGLQVRGHAMFSHEGLPLDSETLEYAWLIEAVIGTVSGKLTTPQVQNIAEFIQTFIMLVDNPENQLIRPSPYVPCQHMVPQHQCRMLLRPDLPSLPFPCPSSEDIKYQMVRLSLDSLNLFMVESGSALNLSVRPVRIAHCNLHGSTTRAGITGVIEQISLKQFMNCAQSRVDTKHAETWLEAGGFALGPITLEAAIALPHPLLHQVQDDFLRVHDKRLKRLWFLWPQQHHPQTSGSTNCGCLGGCEFFGSNKKGATFFRSHKHRESSQVAIPQVCSAGHDPGFGQSLLHEGKLVFEVGMIGLRTSPNKVSPTQFSFTRGYMSDLASPDTAEVPLVSTTMVNDEEVAGSGEGSANHSPVKGTEEMALLREHISPHVAGVRPLSAHSDSLAYQTSTPAVAAGREPRHETQSLYDQNSPQDRFHHRQFLHTSASIPPSPSGVRVDYRNSISSGRSSEICTRFSSKSSLASPVSLRHGFVGAERVSSSISLESEQYFSAEEEALASSENECASAILESTVLASPGCLDATMMAVLEKERSPDKDGTLKSKDSKYSEFSNYQSLSDDRDSTLRASDRSTKPLIEDCDDDHDDNDGDDDRVSSASSSSCSTLSYTSAPSEQDFDSDEIPEDFTLVHLHTHMNQPITNSPLLLNCYMRHLSQFQCHDWLSPGPTHTIYPIKKGLRSVQSEYSLSSASHSMYSATSSWMPHFTKVKEGFSMSVMRQKEEVKFPSPPSRKSTTPVFSFQEEDVEGRGEDEEESDLHAVLSENTSKTTAVVQVTGALDVLVTPLLLESLQRYVEAVTPTLAKLHPSALIDGLHSQCLDRLKQQNKLKKLSEGGDESMGGPVGLAPSPTMSGDEGLDVAKTSSLQALFTLPKINVCVLQASIVEEVIPFSNLDNVNDLMAVSLLSLCLDSLRCQLLANKHSCTLSPLAAGPPPKESLGPKLSTSSAAGVAKAVQDFGSQLDKDKEMTEVSREENVGTLHIARIHLQLRRLLKHSNFSDNIILTAIPDHRSSVLFTFSYDNASTLSSSASSQQPGSPRRRLSRQSSRDWRDDPLLSSIGFIMMECGLEDVSITAVRRLGYKDSEEAQMEEKLDGLEKVLTDLQSSAKEEMEEQAESTSSPTDEPVPLSSPSARQSTASLSSSWDSTGSLRPSDTLDVKTAAVRPVPQPLKGDASTGILKLKTVWFHFAAPPPISIKKKVDFTRLDWNLLSTATPAINAWMNPSDRLMTSVRQLVRVLSMRTCSVIACMMTEALDVQGIHVSYKSKFGKLSSLSKTLQEDPSCQLLTVLRKYLHKEGTSPVEQAVASETVPQIITLQKGILALMRQWKNVLYMPNLAEINFKAKKNVRPYNVTFSLPESESMDGLCLDDEDGTVDNFDVVDERMSLLQAEGGAFHKTPSNASLASKGKQSQSTVGKGDNVGVDGISVESSVSFRNRKLGTLFSQLGARGRSKGGGAASSSGGGGAGGLESPEHRPVPPILPMGGSSSAGLLRNDSNLSFTSMESASSLEQLVSPTPPHTPLKGSGASGGPKPTSILKNRQQQQQQEDLYQWMAKQQQQKDLYQWMAKQQEGFKLPVEEELKYSGRAQHHDSWMGLGSAWSQDDSRTDLTEEQATVATSIMQLADAQILFKPFLQSLGLHVESVRPSAMMKNFGGHLLLQGHLDTLKIQIAESQASPHHKGKGKGKGKRHLLNMNAGTPAFVCEGFEVDVSMKDVVDFGEEQDQGVPVFPKFAMHKLEAKPTTLQINLMVECQSITQHVDMALLRLVHQVLTMVDNIKETQVELKERRSSIDWVRTHRKQESKDSTSSADTQQSDLSHTERLAMELMHTVKAAPSPVHSPIHEKMPPKTLPAKPHLPPSSLATKRPDALSVGGGPKKPLPHLRFAKDAKKVPTPKAESAAAGQAEVLTPPQSLNLSDSVTIDMADTSSPAVNEKTIIDEIKESTPQCWRHLYHLLDLYATMPEPKTVMRKTAISKPLPVIEEEDDKESLMRAESERRAMTPETDVRASTGRVDLAAAEESQFGDHQPLARTSFIRTRFKQSIYIGESVPLVVFGIAKIQKVQMLAELSGLKLEAELRKVHATGTYKKKVKGFLHRKSSDSSFTAHVGHTMIMLLEGVPPGMQTVVTINISRSQALLTTVMRRGKERNSALVSVGMIDVNIPQHPVVLHGMMTRSSRRLTTTLQEFRWPLSRAGFTINMQQHPVTSSLVRKGQDLNDSNNAAPQPLDTVEESDKTDSKQPIKKSSEKVKDKNLHIHFKALFHGLTIGASILPSLKAQHKTGTITVTGITGKKARFNLVLPKHTLSFKSKVTTSGETTIPSSASIELPPIQVIADYRHAKSDVNTASQASGIEEGLQLREGSYLNAVAEVGMLEHSLTTDLLNHLVFVQKVFMKEVNEVVQKVSGSDQPMWLWSEEDRRVIETHHDTLLYSFSIRLKGIQITATTPTSNAVRFETGEITLDLSNRVQISSKDTASDNEPEEAQKMFVQAVVDLNLALGQLLRNPVFEEAEPEFHTMAFFKTTIRVRNALQDEMVPQVSSDQEALLIHLSRPIMLAQPAAFDKAVLVWLNYKNAYEYWTEQRMTLNTEVLTATRQVMDKLPQMAPAAASASFSTLFLQLTVDDMGICVPLNSSPFQSQGPSASRIVDSEPGAALVLTVENTQISACSSGSLISKGKFEGFCLRFANDFETSWDDWKPNSTESLMNLCTVPAGTYELCSRTINKQVSDPMGNAKWILNVTWEMQGIDVHLDTNIGKQLSALGHTLTAIAGDLEETQAYSSDENDAVDYDDLDNEATDTEQEFGSRRTSLAEDILPEIVFSHDVDPKERARHIEHQMNEQAKVVQDLKQLGASESTIEAEKRRLEELQNMLFHDFRRDVLNKLKRQSDRASVIRDKLGLGSRPAHIRSRSYGGRRRDGSKNDSVQLRSQTLDRPPRSGTRLTDPPSSSSRVQFGATRHSTYTPPGSPDSFSMSFDEGDLAQTTTQHSSLKKTWSLQDILSSDSGSSHASDTDADTVWSMSGQGLGRTEHRAEGMQGNSTAKTGSLEPNIDFELDVKVFIDNGKCILYPKEAKEEEFKRQQGKRERSASGESHSITPMNRQKMKRMESAPPSIMAKKQPASQVETTVFFLPSVDVKVHYNSKTSFMESGGSVGVSGPEAGVNRSTSVLLAPDRQVDDVFFSSPLQSPLDQPKVQRRGTTVEEEGPRTAEHCSDHGGETSSGSSSTSRKAVKKANLYAWLSLQTLPEEMIISPCLLDFLEQALEPLPISPSTQHKKAVDMGSMLHLNMDLDASQASLGLPMGGTFFPVDVVVSIKVQPSTIRFNCQPISRVECLLQVPSLELVFSTKKTDVEGLLPDGTPPTKPKLGKRLSSGGRERHTSGNQGGGRARLGSTVSDCQGTANTNSGGLSVTGCLSDFSLYIFHPYGGGQRRFFQGSPSYSGGQRSYLGSILEHGASFMEMAGKDSLSLNVEFIRVNISRTRKMEIFPVGDGSSSKLDPQIKSTVVRFSAICDIGKASFKYDMRRLSEILSLPKAWYRRNLARRLFLGDDSMTRAGGEEMDDSSSSNSSAAMGEQQRPVLTSQNSVSSPSITNLFSPLTPPKRTHHRRASSGDKLKFQLSADLKNEIASRRGRTAAPAQQYPTTEPGTTKDSAQPPGSRTGTGGRSRSKHTSPDLQRHRNSLQPSVNLMSSWETLVLFAVNLSRLDVEVNMSNVMGHTIWKTREVKSTGRLSIDSNGHKNLKISAGLGGSSFDSRGGVVGGAIDLQDLSTFWQVSEDPDLGKDPDHRAGLTLYAIEGRVDYMGSSVLMTRLSSLDVSLHDEWHVEKEHGEDVPVATTRAASLFVNGALEWDQFHLMISRSTTPDLIKLVGKLEEFFSQQLTSSRRAFSAFGSISSGRRSERPPSQDSVLSELRHHRHWQSALEHLTGCHFSMLPHMLPVQGMILGGTITLRGRNLTLASFHGINFRSRYWALFNIQHPYILFSTEAQKMEDEGVHIVQDLQFVVGQEKTRAMAAVPDGPPVATICKVSRGHIAPQQFTSVREWFAYAFCSIEKDIEAFPEIRRERVDSPGETRKSRKSQMYSHETEIIFALPALYMNLKSTHCQGKHEPQQDDAKPVVECSFVTEFYDHIKVAMDAEVILFLHDLVSSYIKEKDKAGSRLSGRGGGGEKSPETERRRLTTDPTTALKQDWREFHCKTWQMEPTVRLLHWASTQIDPVGADYVLQKLGFSHARVTIPKWMQRGFMDPLDKVLSLLVDRLIITLSDQQQKEEETGGDNTAGGQENKS